LSYKFQRLREKLRAAIESGELSGKLPGERQLARRFRVNAKTLSKALTDLAAEGVLARSIGRGTFVRSAAEAAGNAQNISTDRWLLICDPDQVDSAVVRALCDANAGTQITHETTSLRPSFLNSFKTVIDLADATPQSFVRDLLVRNISVVRVGREPNGYSTNAVLVDRVLGASCLARDLMLAGHRRFVAVERRGRTQISQAIRHAAQRYAKDSTVDVAFVSEAVGAVEMGATAVICDGASAAAQVRIDLEKSGKTTPANASIAAVGAVAGTPQCSGYFVRIEQKIEAIVRMVREGNTRRPNTVWLAGSFVDVGTTGPTEMMIGAAARSAGEGDARPLHATL
jgi:hypothetical protein